MDKIALLDVIYIARDVLVIVPVWVQILFQIKLLQMDKDNKLPKSIEKLFEHLQLLLHMLAQKIQQQIQTQMLVEVRV